MNVQDFFLSAVAESKTVSGRAQGLRPRQDRQVLQGPRVETDLISAAAEIKNWRGSEKIFKENIHAPTDNFRIFFLTQNHD